MNIAYLIIAHTDPEHITRLAKKILYKNYVDVYIHIDNKVKIDPFVSGLKDIERINFVENRISVNWGGYSSVEATLSLLKQASKKKYDRYILLQGLDYPLRSNKEILSFFEESPQVEFIRGCKITDSTDKFHYAKVKSYWYFDNINLLKRIYNKLNTLLPLQFRKGYIYDGKRFDIYWGSAQWALTHECVQYILDFSRTHSQFNDYFKHVFPPDETYFHTIIFNSKFSIFTSSGGPEPARRGLHNWQNLHYFEYENSIKVYELRDYYYLQTLDHLFFRKATSDKSRNLLDKIDLKHDRSE